MRIRCSVGGAKEWTYGRAVGENTVSRIEALRVMEQVEIVQRQDDRVFDPRERRSQTGDELRLDRHARGGQRHLVARTQLADRVGQPEGRRDAGDVEQFGAVVPDHHDVPRFHIPDDFKSLTFSQIDHLAQECREWWNFGAGPIPDLGDLGSDPRIMRIERSESTLRVVTREDSDAVAQRVFALKPRSIRTIDLNLEEIFMNAVGGAN